ASNASPISITTPEGNLVEIVGFTQVNDNAYQVDYTFELLNPASHPEQGTDELAKEPISLSVTDQRGNVEGSEVEVSIVDDVPAAEVVKEYISIPLTEAGISGFKAGFLLEETTAVNGSVSGEVLDADAYADRLTWGTPANGSQGSNYVFEDNEDFRTGDTIFTDQLIELGTFTHNNFPILSSGSVLTSTILEVKFTLLIDGVRVEIDAQIELAHDETPNNNPNPQDPENDDIIKITNIDFVQTYTVNDRVYEFKIKGFLDQDGNIVDEIRTTEQASNSFKLFAELASTADIPVFEGQVDYFWGADGAADEDPVIWKDIDAASGVIETDLGILTINPDGSYSYEVKLETRDKLQLGEVLVDSFTYVLKDADGDLVESTLEINLNGVSNTSRIMVETEVDNTGPTIDVTGDTVGIPVGSDLIVTITDQMDNTVTTTAIVEADGSYTVTGLDITTLTDGELDITVTGTDNNGDPVIGIADDVLDAVASAVEVSFDNTDANGVITDDADSVVISGSTTDVLPSSNTVNLVITDQQGNEVVLNDVALDADGNFSVEADLSGLIDGPLEVVASATDNNGNPITGTDNAELDAIAAQITVETEVDNAGPTIDVTGDTTDIPVGSELVVTITDTEGNTVTTTAIVEEDGSYTVPGLDISDLTDGDLDITVTGTDNNGNPVTGTAEDELDAVASAVEVSFDNTDANGVITD
ncbi:VCBS domain-containing protein, partial [Nitrincola alkalisediminis]|uniref:VCBS domain-containing protein n=1 Tax=Nitrincola alkalisediminis TaxID=1366656 RepID=UPI001876445E